MAIADFPTAEAATGWLISAGFAEVPSSLLPRGYANAARPWLYNAQSRQAAGIWTQGSSYRAGTWLASDAPSRAVARALAKAEAGWEVVA